MVKVAILVMMLISFLAASPASSNEDLTGRVINECVIKYKLAYAETLQSYIDKSHHIKQLDHNDVCYRAWYMGEISATHLILKAIDERNAERGIK